MIPSRSTLLLPLLALPLLAAPAAASALRWEPAADGAAIVLPVPAKARGIVGGTLSCAGQEWALRLRTGRAVPGGEARIAVGEDSLAAMAKVSAGTLEIGLSAEALALLKEGSDVTITVGEGDAAASARFPLAGSRAAIEAAAPLCSTPALPGTETVRLVPGAAAADAAREATAGEAALFREATAREPALAAGFVQADDARQLLFASLCGSNRYYGGTGCKLMGFARETAGTVWRPVYESEGMHLFRDLRAAHDGWPDLATVTLAGGERLRWTWRDGTYEVEGEAVATDGRPSLIDELRTGTTGQ